MFDSLQRLGLQPTRLLCPWDSPRQEYWSGFPCPPLGGIADSGIKPMSRNSPALAGRFFTTSEKHLKKNTQTHTHTHVCMLLWTCITESFSCTPETNNIVNQLYFNRNKYISLRKSLFCYASPQICIYNLKFKIKLLPVYKLVVVINKNIQMY